MDGNMDPRMLEKLRAEADTERREGGMRDQLDRALVVTGNLEELAAVLQEKLEPALLEDQPHAVPGTPRPPAVTQWALHLEQLTDRLGSVQERLENLARRVDL
jgi:hypothetical protein